MSTRLWRVRSFMEDGRLLALDMVIRQSALSDTVKKVDNSLKRRCVLSVAPELRLISVQLLVRGNCQTVYADILML